MAKIHGISGSTRILLDGMNTINGRKLGSIDEITFFYDNYLKILSETKVVAEKQQDTLIAALTNDEINLDRHIMDDVVGRRKEVNAHILDLHNKIEASDSFLQTSKFLLQYLFARLKSYQSINPSADSLRELRNIRDRKSKTITYKLFAMEDACKNLVDSQRFLNLNNSFLVGAQGEELVIHILSGLPDGYHVLNDVNLNLYTDAEVKKGQKSIETCQIDHVVVGPTGLFLLETKNWKTWDAEWKHLKIKHQVRRASQALRSYLKEKGRDGVPWIQSIVVSINGYPSGLIRDQYIDFVSPDQLCGYISKRKEKLTVGEIEKLVQLIPYHKTN